MKKALAVIIVGAGFLGLIALLGSLFIVEPVLMSIFVVLPAFMVLFFWAINLLCDERENKETLKNRRK